MTDRLTIPELESRMDAMASEIRRLQREQPPRVSWFVCTRCNSLYQHWGGCGCAIPALVDRISELEKAS